MTASANDIAPPTGVAWLDRSWLLLVIVGSMALRLTLADRAIWDTDEGTNMWMASRIVAGESPSLGQPSSQGVRNLPGAPWLMVPFALLPSLSAVSWTLTAVQLLGLTLLALSFRESPGDRVLSLAVLALLPAAVGASHTPFNQYLCLTLDAFLLAALLRLLAGTDSSTVRSVLALAVAALSLLQPAVHLAYVPDCLVRLAALTWVLRQRPDVDRRVLVGGLLIVAVACSSLTLPWLSHEVDALLGLVWRRIGLLAVAALLSFALAALVIAVVRGGTAVPRRLSALLVDRVVLRVVPALALLVIALTAVATPLTRKALGALEWPAFLLVASQLGLVLCLAPVALRRAAEFGAAPSGRSAAILLGSIAGSSFLCRLAMSPTVVLPSGRLDLLVSLVPAFLGMLLLLAASTTARASRRRLVVAAAIMSLALALTAAMPQSPGFWQRHRDVVPASDMQAGAAALAAHHRRHDGTDVVDVAYDLNLRRRWIPAQARRSGESAYTIGRPLDWLLWRAHGLRNAHEGEYLRNGPARYRLSLPDAAPPTGLRALARTGRLTLWGPSGEASSAP